MQALTASAYVFCKQLESASPEAAHSTSIAFALVQDSRPVTPDWPPLAINNGTWIYFVAQIQYAHDQPLACNNSQPKALAYKAKWSNGIALDCINIEPVCKAHCSAARLPQLLCIMHSVKTIQYCTEFFRLSRAWQSA